MLNKMFYRTSQQTYASPPLDYLRLLVKKIATYAA